VLAPRRSKRIFSGGDFLLLLLAAWKSEQFICVISCALVTRGNFFNYGGLKNKIQEIKLNKKQVTNVRVPVTDSGFLCESSESVTMRVIVCAIYLMILIMPMTSGW
jgi:hypothetical protein